jgi:hypothetical protein
LLFGLAGGFLNSETLAFFLGLAGGFFSSEA